MSRMLAAVSASAVIHAFIAVLVFIEVVVVHIVIEIKSSHGG